MLVIKQFREILSFANEFSYNVRITFSIIYIYIHIVIFLIYLFSYDMTFANFQI